MNDSGGAGGLTSDNMGGAPDTFTYFGSLPDVVIGEGEIELELKEADFQGQITIVNDFVIPPRNKDSAEQHRGRHFQIWFDCGLTQQYAALNNQYDPKSYPETGYYIKDLGIGFGVFKKMDVLSNDLVF